MLLTVWRSDGQPVDYEYPTGHALRVHCTTSAAYWLKLYRILDPFLLWQDHAGCHSRGGRQFVSIRAKRSHVFQRFSS